MCDLAEFYGIYNYRDFKPLYVATLAIGLNANSRIKTDISGAKIPLETMLNALTVDYLARLFWAQTEDGAKNRNRPPSILEALTQEKKKPTVKRFASHDDFKAAWAAATGEV